MHVRLFVFVAFVRSGVHRLKPRHGFILSAWIRAGHTQVHEGRFALFYRSRATEFFLPTCWCMSRYTGEGGYGIVLAA